MTSLMNRQVGLEGGVIFAVVGYETVALAVNLVANRRVIPPITDMLGPLTHHPVGKIGAWLFLGWAFDHFWRRGEQEIYGDDFRDFRHKVRVETKQVVEMEMPA